MYKRFKSEQDFLKAYEKAHRQMRITYNVPFANDDAKVIDIIYAGYDQFGYDGMHKLKKEREKIQEKAAKEIPVK